MFDRFRRGKRDEEAPPSPTATRADDDVERSEGDQPYAVTALGQSAGDQSHSIDFEDLVAHEEDERIDKLAELLDGHPRIRRTFREDREFILLDAPGVREAELEEIVARLWEDAAVGTTYLRLDEATGDFVESERPATGTRGG
jgi:hypothetical protein